MSRLAWEELLWTVTADATAVANTTTETILFPDQTILANYMQDGRCLRITAGGKLSNTASATFIWALRWGGVAGVLLATTEAVNPGSAVTNICWWIDALIQVRTNGASGSMIVMGVLTVSLTSSTSFSQVFGVSGFDAPAAAAATDQTVDKALSLTGDWSAASASNTATGLMYSGESLN